MVIAQQESMADLQGVDIFTSLSDDSLGHIAIVCTQRLYKAGEYCAVQGTTTDQLLIVNGGKFAIEMQVNVPRYINTLTIATLTKGHVCAWSAIVPPHVLTASIRCIDDGHVIGIKETDLQRIFKEKPAIESAVMRNLAAVISSRLKDTREKLTQFVAEVIKEGIKQGI